MEMDAGWWLHADCDRSKNQIFRPPTPFLRTVHVSDSRGLPGIVLAPLEPLSMSKVTYYSPIESPAYTLMDAFFQPVLYTFGASIWSAGPLLAL